MKRARSSRRTSFVTRRVQDLLSIPVLTSKDTPASDSSRDLNLDSDPLGPRRRVRVVVRRLGRWDSFTGQQRLGVKGVDGVSGHGRWVRSPPPPPTPVLPYTHVTDREPVVLKDDDNPKERSRYPSVPPKNSSPPRPSVLKLPCPRREDFDDQERRQVSLTQVLAVGEVLVV